MKRAGLFLPALAFLAAGLLPGAEAYRREGIDSYAEELSLRLWGGAARQEMYDARVAILDENAQMHATDWSRSINERSLKQALGGGFEVSYGFFRDVKLTLALEGRGSSAGGWFQGEHSNTAVHPTQGRQRQRVDRESRYTAFGQEGGVTVLLREFGWSRFALTGRLGRHALAGAMERGSDTGPLRSFWWKRELSGNAPSGMAGVEWEWFAPPRPLPLSGFMVIGYRWLEFSRVSVDYSDSRGVVQSGAYMDRDGRRRSFDMSGPEFRFGLQIVTPFTFDVFAE